MNDRNQQTSGCPQSPLNESSGKVEKGALGPRIVRVLLWTNTAFLIGLATYLYFDKDALEHTSFLLGKLRWWSEPWGQYVPAMVNKAVSAESQGALELGFILGGSTLGLAVASAFMSRGRERFFLPFFALLLSLGWVSLGSNWELVRLRGQSTDLIQYAAPVGEFANLLENSWPDQGGEIKDFGAFLAYPYGKPRTLLMLGDSQIPKTPLQVAAVERTPEKAIRLQLAGDAPDIWLEWRVNGTPPTLFQGGLLQTHTPLTFYEIAPNTYVVKYLITGPEPLP